MRSGPFPFVPKGSSLNEALPHLLKGKGVLRSATGLAAYLIQHFPIKQGPAIRAPY